MLTGDAKVFFLKGKIIENNQSLSLIALKHPGTGQKAHYHLQPDHVYESIEFGEKNRSFFINDFVSANGKIYLLSRIDPLFLIAPYFIKQTRPTPVDDILHDAKYPDLAKLAAQIDDKQLALIADPKGPADLRAFVFNEDKFMFWLSRKAANLIQLIKAKNLKVKQTATSELYQKTELHATDEASEQEYLRSAHAIISDYLTIEHSDKLERVLGILQAGGAQNKKRKYMDGQGEEASPLASSKKAKPNEPEVVKVEKKVTAKEKALEKAAKGTKSIASFFGAKPKK